jgi:diguanylate cyclase (GGDEF)-like protein
MTVLDRPRPDYSPTALDVPTEILPAELDEQILRIQRIGKRMFRTGNCLVVLGSGVAERREGEMSRTILELAFCSSMPHSDKLIVVHDTRADQLTRQHRMVVGAPHVRFFAAYPIFNVEHAVVGSINLIDYVPHAFGNDDQAMLADLACLVERELHLRSMSESQLVLQKKNKNLRRKSMIDPLIGTWNRGAIMRIIEIESIRCEKLNIPLSLVIVDLDHFKKINDSHGHPVGDAVLVRAASRMRSCIRPQEALGRYGGEEFMVVLPGSSQYTAQAVAERMRATIAAQAENIGGTLIDFTISAGVASTEMFPHATTEELINRADVALYRAKEAGRNKVICATPD